MHAANVLTVVQDYKVSALFTAPTALRAVRRDDPKADLMRKYNLRSLRTLFLAGERSEPSIISAYQRYLDEMGAPGALVNEYVFLCSPKRLTDRLLAVSKH